MKKSYLILLSALTLFSCKPDKKETPEPAKVLGFHKFSGSSFITDAVYCSNGRLMVLTPSVQNPMSIIKGVDENGNLWFENNFADDNIIRYHCIAEGPDNGVILGGSSNGAIVLEKSTQGGLSMGIIGFDKNVKKQWTFQTAFEDPTTDKKFLLRLKDGNYISLDWRSFSSDRMQTYFTWFRPDGSVYRERQSYVIADAHWNSVVETPDKGFLCTGDALHMSTTLCVTKFSDVGAPLWTYTHNGAKLSVGERSIALEDGSLLVVGRYFNVNANENFSGVLLRISATGTLLWEKEFTANGPVDFKDIIADGNGGFIITGYGTDPVTHEQHRVMLRSVSADGTEQWSKYYEPNGTGKRVFMRPDGGYMVAGDLLQEMNFFVLITDKNGGIE